MYPSLRGQQWRPGENDNSQRSYLSKSKARQMTARQLPSFCFIADTAWAIAQMEGPAHQIDWHSATGECRRLGEWQRCQPRIPQFGIFSTPCVCQHSPVDLGVATLLRWSAGNAASRAFSAEAG